MAPEIACIVMMGNQPTARDRVNVIYGTMEKCVASGPTKQDFDDEREPYKKGPVSVVTEELVAGVKPSESEHKFVYMIDVSGDWKNDLDVGLDVLRHAADEWHTMEVADKARASLRK